MCRTAGLFREIRTVRLITHQSAAMLVPRIGSHGLALQKLESRPPLRAAYFRHITWLCVCVCVFERVWRGSGETSEAQRWPESKPGDLLHPPRRLIMVDSGEIFPQEWRLRRGGGRSSSPSARRLQAPRRLPRRESLHRHINWSRVLGSGFWV